MPKQKKTWVEKRACASLPQVKIIDKSFAGIPTGSKMLISSPTEIDSFIRNLPNGTLCEVAKMRQLLAEVHHADATCPVTTGIFLRIVAEAAYEEYLEGKQDITPFWRVIDPESTLAKKLMATPAFIVTRRVQENIITTGKAEV